MKVMPEGRGGLARILLLAILVGVLGYALYSQMQPQPLTSAPAVSTPAASNLPGAANGARPTPGTATATSQAPQALRLEEIEVRLPGEPQAKRNLFRFGVRPPPPPPPLPPAPAYTPPPTPTPTGPPPPPPIPIKLTGVMRDPYGKLRAYLVETTTGKVSQSVQGDSPWGAYRLLEVGPNYVVIERMDGSGRRRITIGG